MAGKSYFGVLIITNIDWPVSFTASGVGSCSLAAAMESSCYPMVSLPFAETAKGVVAASTAIECA